MGDRVSLLPGSRLMLGGTEYQITHALDLNTLLGKRLDTGEVLRLKRQEIAAALSAAKENSADKADRADLATIPEDQWREAQRRFDLLQPLLTSPKRTKELAIQQAKKANVHVATIYRWLDLYRAQDRISALLPPTPSGGRGKSRLASEVLAVIDATIESYYLTQQKPSAQKTCEEVRRRCLKLGLESPHDNTVRRRIATIAAPLAAKRRESGRVAYEQFAPHRGSFPGADWPLAVWQIDHTPVDIVLVDDVHRQPIGRPWITVAIDVYSRCVAGFYLSLDPPSATSVGLCLVHAMLPKDTWLAKHEIQSPWPMWGIPAKIHADNAREFRGAMLQRACEEYGVQLEWRPVKNPHYGGHIERLLGTFNHDVHALPGTTFSNPKQRGEYKSTSKSVFTLSEFETWLATYICDKYHLTLHDGINCSPLKRLERGLLGDEDTPGRGLPPLLADPDRLRLDFMPLIDRTVQQYGIQLDGIKYYHDVLKPWIHATLPGRAKAKQKFIVRRDPRDISTIYFLDPENNDYHAIPYRNLHAPTMSLWELNAVLRRLKDDGMQSVDEAAIFAGHERLLALQETAKKKTLAVRRRDQRRREHRAVASAPKPGARASSTSAKALATMDAWDDTAPVAPFDDIDVMTRTSR